MYRNGYSRVRALGQKSDNAICFGDLDYYNRKIILLLEYILVRLFGNSADKLCHPRSVVYSAEQVL